MRRLIFLLIILALRASAAWPAGGVKVVQTPESISNPQMIYINDGSVIISWHEQHGTLSAGYTYCQKLDTTGVILWNPRGIRVCLHDSLVRDHHMVTDGQDVWFVWQDCRNEGSYDGGDIYVQKIDGSTGQRLWGEQGKVVCVKQGFQHQQKCTTIDGGSLGVTWQDFTLDSTDASVQYLLPDGSLVWDSLV